MGEPIKRATLGAVAKEYETRGNVGGARQEQQTEFNPGAVFFGKNIGSDAILPGDRLGLYGLRYTLSSFTSVGFEYARRRLLNNKLKVGISRLNSNSPDVEDYGVNATALTPARTNHICKFKVTPSDFFLTFVYVPSGVPGTAGYYYVDIYGVASAVKNDDTFARTWGEFSTESSPDQQGGRYIVALCKKLQEEGLSLEEVDDEIEATLAETTTTIQYISSTHFAVSTDGYLTITSASTSKTVYAP